MKIRSIFSVILVFTFVSACSESVQTVDSAAESCCSSGDGTLQEISTDLEAFLNDNGYEAWMVGIESPPDGASVPSFSVSANDNSCACGDLTGDQMIDIADIQALVTYLFFDNEEVPTQANCADIDGVPGVDISDLSYLIDYMFFSGPVPCAYSNGGGTQPPPPVENISGYSDLVNTCADQGTPLGYREMDTGAGQAMVSGPVRANTQNITSSDLAGGGPVELTQSNTEYVLQDDIAVTGTAFVIDASDVTLNLNGHTVTYANETIASCDSNGVMFGDSGGVSGSILNGQIIQGAQDCDCQDYQWDVAGMGCNPIRLYPAPTSVEIAGLEIVYRSEDTSAVYGGYTDNMNIHHNTIRDQGDVVENRHHLPAVIKNEHGTNNIAHHNLIVGARHAGILLRHGGQAHHNEIHIDSRYTNSVGLQIYGERVGDEILEGQIYNNKVFGTGEHPVGMQPGSYTNTYGNYVEVESTRYSRESSSSGVIHSDGFRITWGYDDVFVKCNHFEVIGGNVPSEPAPGPVDNDRSIGRGMMIGLTSYDQVVNIDYNFVRALNSDGESAAKAIVIAHSSGGEGGTPVFRGNVIVSNYGNIVLADRYGDARGFSQFIGNHFVQEGSNENYETIRSDYINTEATGVFMDNSFDGGASYEKVDLYPWDRCTSFRKEIVIGHYDQASQVIDYYLTNDSTTMASGSSSESFDSCSSIVYP